MCLLLLEPNFCHFISTVALVCGESSVNINDAIFFKLDNFSILFSFPLSTEWRKIWESCAFYITPHKVFFFFWFYRYANVQKKTWILNILHKNRKYKLHLCVSFLLTKRTRVAKTLSFPRRIRFLSCHFMIPSAALLLCSKMEERRRATMAYHTLKPIQT